MPITLLLEAIKAGFEFATELLKFYQTPQGEKVVERMLADRANWDAHWTGFETRFRKFFKIPEN